MRFQIIFFLRPVGCGHRDDLADRRCCCARAIDVPVERLLLTFALRPNSSELRRARGAMDVWVASGAGYAEQSPYVTAFRRLAAEIQSNRGWPACWQQSRCNRDNRSGAAALRVW